MPPVWRRTAGLACLLWLATPPALAQTPAPDAPSSPGSGDDGSPAPQSPPGAQRPSEGPNSDAGTDSPTPDERPTSAAGEEPSDRYEEQADVEESSRASTETESADPAPPAGRGADGRPEAADPTAPAPERQPSAAPGEPASPPSASSPTPDATLRSSEPSDLSADGEPPRPLPRDRIGGHFVAGLGAAVAVPFGELSPGVGYHDIANAGAGFVLDAGYGVARDVVIGAYGEFQLYSGADGCAGCSATGIGAGAYIRYHLVQGLRFDPWVSYGIGYRGIEVSGAASEPVGDYAGLEWMRLTFGGDWYAFSQFGFGPFVQFGAASMFDRPAGELDGGVNWRWQIGLRVVVDLPGK